MVLQGAYRLHRHVSAATVDVDSTDLAVTGLECSGETQVVPVVHTQVDELGAGYLSPNRGELVHHCTPVGALGTFRIPALDKRVEHIQEDL
ncbi:hypothetical protein MICRO8M_90063 [Microbacterium sp. 8M]|nr:hypothetical protein MICRO8M_90063 [Microbacterium sp. 8M]